MSKYSVEWWTTHPDCGHDDCLSGIECESLEHAMSWYNTNLSQQTIGTGTLGDENRTVQWIILRGLDSNVYFERKNPEYQPAPDASAVDAYWQNEFASQAGMAGGVHAYNDAMGY